MAKKIPGSEVETPASATVEKKPVEIEAFNGNGLRMLSDGLYRYVCKENTLVKKETFHCEGAKAYGLRTGDIVFSIDADNVKLVLV